MSIALVKAARDYRDVMEWWSWLHDEPACVLYGECTYFIDYDGTHCVEGLDCPHLDATWEDMRVYRDACLARLNKFLDID